MHIQYAIDLLKREQNVGYVEDGIITNAKGPQRKEHLKNTRKKYTTSVKNDKDQKQLEVAIRELRRQLQEEEENRSEVEKKYKNLEKIQEPTKIENKIYQTEIQKLEHEKDTAEEVIKGLRNANFNKIHISLGKDKERQIQKLNSILEKEQGMKKIVAKDNMELKEQNQTLQTKMREN